MLHAVCSPPRNKKKMESKIRVAITQGDINGIGYELILKAFASSELFEVCTPVVFGSEQIMQIHRKATNLNTPCSVIPKASDALENRLNVVNVVGEAYVPNVVFGQTTEEAGRLALYALDAAVKAAQAGDVDVIVACPINLAAMPRTEFPYTSQNEYFGQKFEGTDLMMLCNPFMRVAMATNHQPLRTVAESITAELLETRIRQAYASVSRDFLCAAPRVAVLGLNPHAGSAGQIGNEDSDIIATVISKLADEDIRVFGPYATDGFFGAGMFKHFDCVLAMYHDQGVTPFKTLSMEEGVNYTAGLDVICVSPDHGPAYDIAGKGVADATSFLHAIYNAIDIYRHRETYDEAHQHPLPHVVQHDRREDRRPFRQE